jgi:hypothetical protein
MTISIPRPDQQPGFKISPPAAVALVGTAGVCAAAVVAQFAGPSYGPIAAGLWFLGLLLQAAGFAMALAKRGR